MTEQEHAVSLSVGAACIVVFACLGVKTIRRVWRDREPLRELRRATEIAENMGELWHAVLAGAMSMEQFKTILKRKVVCDDARRMGLRDVHDDDGGVVADVPGVLHRHIPASGDVAPTAKAEPGTSSPGWSVVRATGRNLWSVVFRVACVGTRVAGVAARWGASRTVRSMSRIVTGK